MPTKPIPTETKLEAQRLRKLGWSLIKIAAHLKISHGSASNICRDLQVQKKTVEDQNESTIEFDSDKPIKSLEDACVAASVDLSIWYVDSWECSQWTVGMNIKGKDEPVQTQQYRVKLKLKRLLKRSIQEAINAIFERMKKYAPKYKKIKLPQSGPETLAVTCLFDVHFGKLAWNAETGNSYDLKIAEKIFKNAVIDLMAHVKDRKISRFCLPLGNDFFHIDNKRNTTYLGTPQDTDSRYAKIFETGKMAVIWAIEYMIQFADVDVLWVPGNHDPTTSYHLVETISSWFNRTKNVQVDCTPPQRKYYTWHNMLLGFTHGDKMKPESLPNLMALEKPEDWAKCDCREWLLGHQHRSQKWVSKDTDTYQGTTVRTIQALTATDAWHYEQGFVGSRRAAEILLYEKDFGYVGNLIAQARA